MNDDYLGSGPDHRREHDLHVALALLALTGLILLAAFVFLFLSAGVVQ